MYEVNLKDIFQESIEIPTPTTNQTDIINNVYHLTKMKEVIQYLHWCCFSPKISTWCDAIDKGFFATWPHLTSKMVRKYLPQSEATTKGHQHRSPKKTRSTKEKEITKLDKKITIIPQTYEITNCIYTDQTGKFPHK